MMSSLWSSVVVAVVILGAFRGAAGAASVESRADALRSYGGRYVNGHLKSYDGTHFIWKNAKGEVEDIPAGHIHGVILLKSDAAFKPVTVVTTQGQKVVLNAGDQSWADAVVSYRNGDPATKKQKEPGEAVGKPDYRRSGGGYVSLGHGGELVLEFVDNRLVDVPGDDLLVLEIGDAVEPIEVAISEDGKTWIELGRAKGSRSSFDISSKAPPGARFRFVRVTDGKAARSNNSDWAGADIDAVAAIGSVGD